MMPRKTYDNAARDKFAHDAGIELDNERGGVFDELHKIEADRFRERLSEHAELFAQYDSELKRLDRRSGVWQLCALLGWGMFAIALMSHLLK